MKSVLGSFFIFILSFGSIPAQNIYNHKLYTTDNGLPHNQIEWITRDKTGFLWIATWNGLSRFDGYEFRNYFHKSSDSTSFPFFSLDKVITDKYDNLWVFSERRPLVCFDKNNESFNRLTPDSLHSELPTDIALGNDSILWFTSGLSIGRYDHEKRKLNLFRLINESGFRFSPDKSGLQLIFDNKGQIWLYYTEDSKFHICNTRYLNDSTILVGDYGSISFKDCKSASMHNTTGNIDIYISDSGNVWIFSRFGLYRYDRASRRIMENRKMPDPAEFTGKPYFIWTDDNSGIHIIDTKSNSIKNILLEEDNYIETTYVDNSGIVWCGNINPEHSNLGLHQYIETPSYFRNYICEKKAGKASFVVFPVLKVRDRICVLSKNNNNLVLINKDCTEEELMIHDRFNKSNSLRITSLASDSTGIWIGMDGQLSYYNFNTGLDSVCAFRYNDTISYSIAIHSFIKSGNNLIINGVKGVYKYNSLNRLLKFGYLHKPEGSGFSIVPDGGTGYWLSSLNSTIVHLDKDLNKINRYKIGKENNVIQHICVGDSNDIWMSIMGEGLGHFYPATGRTEIFSIADGLNNNITYSILKDKKGILWISTDMGISRFDPRTRHFRNYSKEEGMNVKVFNPGSFSTSEDGEMFFGAIGGFVGFYPDSVDIEGKKSFNTRLIISDLKVSGIPRYFRKPVYDLDSIVLRKGDNNIQITFAALNFRNPEKIRYRYRLIRENSKWTEADFRNRTVSLANLLPALYKLQFQATDENGRWSDSKSVCILIPAFFRETQIFRILVTSIVILTIIFLGHLYIRQIRLKALQYQNQLKLESLRGQMNPHFIFNSLNSINYFIMNEDKLAANDYIADFSRLIRSFLDNVSNEYIAFNKELEVINDYLKLEHLRFRDKFDYSVSIENVSDRDSMLVLPGFIQPFIENAIWHGIHSLKGRKGRIRIIFRSEDPETLHCTIEDNGIGRKLAALHNENKHKRKSRGTGIVRDRLKIINNSTRGNYHFTIDDLNPEKEETGTVVQICLPVKSI